MVDGKRPAKGATSVVKESCDQLERSVSVEASRVSESRRSVDTSTKLQRDLVTIASSPSTLLVWSPSFQSLQVSRSFRSL